MAKIIKITELSRDFGMKSKDLIDSFKAVSIEKNSGGSVTDIEFEVIMQHLTSTHQMKNIDDYMDGKITITAPKKEKKAAPKAEAPKAEAPKAETPKKAEAPKAEAPKAEATKAEAPKPAAKPEAKREGAPKNNNSARPERQGAPKGDRGYNRDRGENRYGARPSDDPFAKRRENMNAQASGFKRDGTPVKKNNAPERRDEVKTAPIAAQKAAPAETQKAAATETV